MGRRSGVLLGRDRRPRNRLLSYRERRRILRGEDPPFATAGFRPMAGRRAPLPRCSLQKKNRPSHPERRSKRAWSAHSASAPAVIL